MAIGADALCEYLETRGLGTRGTNIFSDYLPDGEDVADTILSIWEEGGWGNYSFSGTPMSVSSQITLHARSTAYSYEDCRDLAFSAWKTLHEVENQTFTVLTYSVRVLSVTWQFHPIIAERDQHERPYFVAMGSCFYVVSYP